MKKEYDGIKMCVETYTLTQTIAATCPAVVGNYIYGRPQMTSSETCGWNVGGNVYWLDSNAVCTQKVDENADINGACYNVPSGGITIFGS